MPEAVRKSNSTPIWLKMATAVSNTMTTESTKRSVTTVPILFVKEVPSQRFNVPQRVTSPMRGMTRLVA